MNHQILLAMLDGLNSSTKYPSIPTYHTLGARGKLQEESLHHLFEGGEVFYSEKVDGTNTRTIVFPEGDLLVGSRNDLLYYSKDLLFNPAQGIVEAILPHLPKFPVPSLGRVNVYFGESYGGEIGRQAKNYGHKGQTGFRLFDVASFSLDELVHRCQTWTVDQIAGWRENGGQPFVPHDQLLQFGLDLTPRLQAPPPPKGIADTYKWLQTLLPSTLCALGEEAKGVPEGVVVRNADRTAIAKIRFEDYARTLR